jgi:hypothetical protein
MLPTLRLLRLRHLELKSETISSENGIRAPARVRSYRLYLICRVVCGHITPAGRSQGDENSISARHDE